MAQQTAKARTNKQTKPQTITTTFKKPSNVMYSKRGSMKEEGQTGETRRGHRPPCHWAAAVCGALPGGGGGADRELTVRITRRVGTSDIIVGACYRLPGQEDQADETLCRQKQPHVHKPWSSRGTSAGTWTEASDVMHSVFQNCSLPLNDAQYKLLTKSSLLCTVLCHCCKKALIQRCWRVCK